MYAHVMSKLRNFVLKDSSSVLSTSYDMGIPEIYNDNYIPEEIQDDNELMVGDVSNASKSPVKQNKCTLESKEKAQTKKSNINLETKTKKPKETPSKLRYEHVNKSTFQSAHHQCKSTVSKKKSALVRIPINNPSAEVVLLERKVQIKDLESEVVYLQNQIKELKIENKTLCDVQSRQAKELKKFKTGVADIPSLLKSHKEETKMLQKTIETLRKEIKDCKQDLKMKHDIIFRKDNQIEKKALAFKQMERELQNTLNEVKKLKTSNRSLEEENGKILGVNKVLKYENVEMLSKIQQMTCMILKLENDVKSEKNSSKLITMELNDLKEKLKDLELASHSSKPTLSNEDLLVKSYDTKCNYVLEKTDDPIPSNEGSKDSVTECLMSPKNVCDVQLNEQRKSMISSSKTAAMKKEICMSETLQQHSKVKDSEFFKRTNTTKEALIHAFKVYDNVCKRMDNDMDSNVNYEVPSVSKPLPPLKQIARRSIGSSTNFKSNLCDKNLNSSIFSNSSSLIFPTYWSERTSESKTT